MCGKIGLLAISPPHFAVAGRRRRGLGRRNPRPGAFRSGEPGGPGCQKPDFSARKGARSGAVGTRPARWSRRPCAAAPRRGGWANVDECGRGGGREGADAGAAGWGAGCGGTDQHIVILSERSAPKDPCGDSGMRCGWYRTGSFDCGGSRRLRSLCQWWFTSGRRSFCTKITAVKFGMAIGLLFAHARTGKMPNEWAEAAVGRPFWIFQNASNASQR